MSHPMKAKAAAMRSAKLKGYAEGGEVVSDAESPFMVGQQYAMEDKEKLPMASRRGGEGSGGYNMLENTLRETTNRGIIDNLPKPPSTYSGRIIARTKGMSRDDAMNSDEVWAMARVAAEQQGIPFSKALQTMSNTALKAGGHAPITDAELANSMVQAAQYGIGPMKWGQ